MKSNFSVLILGTLALGLGGCATVLNGTNVDYTTDTRPDGALVTFTNGETCTTPCELEFARKSDQRADFSLAGYKSAYVLIQSRLGGSTFGNIILGGGIGAVVDGSNGASNRLHPRPLIVQLAQEGSDEEAVLLDKDGDVVMTVQEHNDSVREDVAKTIGFELAEVEAPPTE